MSAFQKRPLAYVCFLCGRKYGSQSLLIHVPQCAVKWCHQHNKATPPSPPSELPATAEQLPRGADAIEAFNAAMMGYWQQAALEHCPHCNRTFRPEALAVHSKLCSAEKPLKHLRGGKPGGAAAAALAVCDTSTINILQSSNSTAAGTRAQQSHITAAVGTHKAAAAGGTINAVAAAASVVHCKARSTSSSNSLNRITTTTSSSSSSAAAAVTPSAQGQGSSAAVGVGRMPRGLVCYLCGGQFFAKSLPIHLPQCELKWRQQQQQQQHSSQQHCPPPAPPAAIAAMLSGELPLPTSRQDLEAFNAAAFEAFNSSSLVPCKACGRTFRPEVLLHHGKHCSLGRPMARR